MPDEELTKLKIKLCREALAGPLGTVERNLVHSTLARLEGKPPVAPFQGDPVDERNR